MEKLLDVVLLLPITGCILAGVAFFVWLLLADGEEQ